MRPKGMSLFDIDLGQSMGVVRAVELRFRQRFPD